MRDLITRRAVAVALPLVPLATSAPATARAGADASLVDLSERWKAFADQRDACFKLMEGLDTKDPRCVTLDKQEERLYEQQARIEETIFAAPATGIAGLAVKARLLAWLNDVVGPLDVATIETAMQGKSDFSERCALSLARDIVRLAERENLS